MIEMESEQAERPETARPTEKPRELRFWNESRLAELSDRELADWTVRRHHSLIGGIHNLTRTFARQAGLGLIEMKQRVRARGENWTAWLADDDNFPASPQTAQVYMRIARHWPKLEAEGFSTLEEMRDFLTKHSKARKKKKSAKPKEPPLNVEGDGSTAKPRHVECGALIPRKDNAEFQRKLEDLRTAFGWATPGETLVYAVQVAYQERLECVCDI
jgi:hypothetical protein